ncbi:MAG: hypothetical protein ABL997_07260 [Planctomycetota bacterium]
MLSATLRSLLLLCGSLAVAVAQEGAAGPLRFGDRLHSPANAPKTVSWTLFVYYVDDTHDYRDHESWLADLQARYGERGLAVVVGAEDRAARRIADTTPGFAVAKARHEAAMEIAATPGAVRFRLQRGAESVACEWSAPDSAQDRIEAALASDLARTSPGEVDDLLESLLYQIGDGGEFTEPVAHCAKALPHSGRARALQVLEQWWCKGDLRAARTAFDAAMVEISSDPVALVHFADLVLRGDRTDPAIAKTLAMSLAPAAATAGKGAFTQLVYMRALLMSGQDRLGARVAAPTEKLVSGSPQLQLWFAETLMEASAPAAFRELAERALSEAEKAGFDARLLTVCRHKVLVRCGADAAAIDALLATYRGDRAYEGSLNNDAWYLTTEIPTMGRFAPFALAQVDEMSRLAGDALDNGSKDTVALVAFCNGQYERAVELQKVACEQSNSDPRYAARLQRFEQALASRRAASKPSEPHKR